MVKLRKQRRRKVYRHNINRKRLRNKLNNKGSIGCKQIKEAWEERKSTKKNLLEMGLSHDPNATIQIPETMKKEKMKLIKPADDIEMSSDDDIPTVNPTKALVVKELIKEAKAPRVKRFRLPKGQVEWITYLMTKYGTDYKAMARDAKNFNQETWKQLRAKIKRFRGIPEQFNKYLEESGKTREDFEGEAMSDDSD